MALPTGWPPRVCSGRRSIRFYKTGAASGVFADNAFLFSDDATANTFTPLPVVKAGDVTPPGTPPGTTPGTITTLPPVPSGTGQQPGKDPDYKQEVHPMIWAQTIRIQAVGGDLEFSFDGNNVHGIVLAGKEATYRMRFEAGIAVRGAATAFYIEAW